MAQTFAVLYSEDDGDTWIMYDEFDDLREALDEKNVLIADPLFKDDCLITTATRNPSWYNHMTKEDVEVD